MSAVRRRSALAIFSTLFFVPGVAFAQTLTGSDLFYENVIDVVGGTVGLTQSATYFEIPEGASEPEHLFNIPAREINFREGSIQGPISDRLSIEPYQVRIRSDDSPDGLPRRSGAILIPASALENFQPIKIVARSDADSPGPESDSLTISTGGIEIFHQVIPETTETGADPVLSLPIVPLQFDIEEPLIEAGFPGVISDYFDILTEFNITFISTDNQLVYQLLPAATGDVLELPFANGDTLTYSLEFRSDVVPEPASFVLFALGLLSVGLTIRKRSNRT